MAAQQEALAAVITRAQEERYPRGLYRDNGKENGDRYNRDIIGLLKGYERDIRCDQAAASI